MRFTVLGSGSKGNATLVESGGLRVLIDNGFSAKALQQRLRQHGVEPTSLSALLITHEHSDHVAGVGVLARQLRLPVYANSATHHAMQQRCGLIPERREFTTGEAFLLNDIRIHPFSVCHDSADPVGFVLSDRDHSLGYCTDTGVVTRLIAHHVQRCQALILEANHDLEMLKLGPYPLRLKQRVLSHQGHLSNHSCLELAASLAAGGLKQLILAHLSEINNHPALVLKAAQTSLAAHTQLEVTVASQHTPSPFIGVACSS